MLLLKTTYMVVYHGIQISYVLSNVFYVSCSRDVCAVLEGVNPSRDATAGNLTVTKIDG